MTRAGVADSQSTKNDTEPVQQIEVARVQSWRHPIPYGEYCQITYTIAVNSLASNLHRFQDARADQKR
jgi:hypothetical protein